MRSLIFYASARLLSPLLLVFALFLLLRGKDAPGGAFSAGLVAASAFILHAIALDPEATRRLLRAQPVTLVAVGLLISAAAALAAPLAGGPFFGALWIELRLPFLPAVMLGTPLLFELGVFLAVLGATLALILPLAER